MGRVGGEGVLPKIHGIERKDVLCELEGYITTIRPTSIKSSFLSTARVVYKGPTETFFFFPFHIFKKKIFNLFFVYILIYKN